MAQCRIHVTYIGDIRHGHHYLCHIVQNEEKQCTGTGVRVDATYVYVIMFLFDVIKNQCWQRKMINSFYYALCHTAVSRQC